MASASDEYLRKLGKRGYDTTRINGNGHREVWYGDLLVTTASGSRGDGGRGFANLRSRIRQFEQGKARVRKRK